MAAKQRAAPAPQRRRVALIVSVSVAILTAALTGVVAALGGLSTIHYAEIIAAAGVAVSAYVLAYKVWGTPLLCPRGGLVNCKMVLDSRFSVWFGVPSALFGMLFFAFELVAFYIGSYPAALAAGTLGVMSVFERIRAQASIGRICIYCNVTHIFAASLFLLSAYLCVH